MVKVAINGFGRIGRNTLRAAIREGIFNEIDNVAKIKLTGGNTGDVVLTVEDIEFVAKGATTLKFVSGDFSATVLIQLDNVADAALQLLKVSGSSLETAITKKAEVKTITVSLAGQTANGFAASGAAIMFTAKAPVPMASTGDATFYQYTVAKDGKLLDSENKNFVGNTFTNIVGAASSEATKLATGNYVVTAYKVVQNGTAQIVSVVGTSNFTVTDNQLKPEMKQLKEKVDSFDDVSSAFEFKFNGEVVSATSFAVQKDGSGENAFVKSAVVEIETETGLGFVKFDMPIGVILKKNN